MIMYRLEQLYGSGVRDLQEIIVFEISELGNTDVLIYSLSHYREYFSDNLAGRLESFINNEEYFEAHESYIRDLVNIYLRALSTKFGYPLKYGLWLAEKSRFSIEMQPELDAYYTSDVVLSDLGLDGKLFAYEHMPEPIEQKEPDYSGS